MNAIALSATPSGTQVASATSRYAGRSQATGERGPDWDQMLVRSRASLNPISPLCKWLSVVPMSSAVGMPLTTIEWSPVEPQLEKKYYVAGLGEIREEVVQGGHEQFQLVNVTH